MKAPQSLPAPLCLTHLFFCSSKHFKYYETGLVFGCWFSRTPWRDAFTAMAARRSDSIRLERVFGVNWLGFNFCWNMLARFARRLAVCTEDGHFLFALSTITRISRGIFLSVPIRSTFCFGSFVCVYVCVCCRKFHTRGRGRNGPLFSSNGLAGNGNCGMANCQTEPNPAQESVRYVILVGCCSGCSVWGHMFADGIFYLSIVLKELWYLSRNVCLQW